jgi:hypothetical protein
MDMDFVDKIIETDTLNKLYQLFEDTEQTQILNRNKTTILSYKTIQDNENVFIMIDWKFLNEILNKIPSKT